MPPLRALLVLLVTLAMTAAAEDGGIRGRLFRRAWPAAAAGLDEPRWTAAADTLIEAVRDGGVDAVATACCGSDGGFQLRLPPGRYRLRVAAWASPLAAVTTIPDGALEVQGGWLDIIAVNQVYLP